MSWLPARFDRQGWRETITLLDEMLVRRRAIQEESAIRLASGSEQPIAVAIATLAFETSPAKEPANGTAHALD